MNNIFYEMIFKRKSFHIFRNVGTLWFGIGKIKEEPFENMEFVIMFSIRKISDDSKYRKDMFKGKRKSVE